MILKLRSHFELGCLKIMGQRNNVIKKMYFNPKLPKPYNTFGYKIYGKRMYLYHSKNKSGIFLTGLSVLLFKSLKNDYTG